MADNFDNYGMKVQATASVKMPSVREINKQIDTLEESIKKLRISGKFDDSALKNLTNQLNSLKATVSTANFSPTALSELTSQVEKALSNIRISTKVGQEVGSAITKGMQHNIDTGVVDSIRKISDSTTSTVVQNEKKKQDAYRATTETVMYHAGVVSKLNKAETNGRFYGSSRGTGYFGTGHYFVDSATKHELDNNSSYSKLPYTSIDISKYDNLFKANTDEIANRLHSFLENLTKFTQGSDANSISELFSQFKKVFGDTVMDMQEFDAKLEQLKSFMQNSNMSDRSDSVSTQFMKSLGYGGVDTRGTRYADTRYGTVIYDLKEESVLQANITDELQKQGQMLEKINYEKGQVFDKTEDSRIQSIIDQQAKSKEIEAEFDKLFDSTKLKEYESELDSVSETLKKNDDIISDCQHSINNADEEAKKFAKDMANLGLDMSEDEIKSQADDYRVTFQERIDELEKERPLLESRKKQLEENLNAEYELANVAREQARQIVDERHKEVQSIQEVSDRVKSFSELKIKSDDFVNIDGLTKAEDILDKVRAKYEQFGQVTFKNIELDADGNLKSFRVNIQQTNGDLKETRNFLMEISDDAKKVKFADDTIKGTENVVRHLNEQKDATDEIIKEEQKLANAMADVREKSEQNRQTEEKRQQMAQNKAINKALEEEYNQKQKLIAQEEKLAQVTAEKANKIQLSFDTGNYQSKVDSLVARTNQWVDANGNARISTESLQTALKNLGTAYTNLNSSGGNTVANQQALIEAEKALDTEVKKVQSSITSMNSTMAKSSAVDALRQKYQMFYDTNTAAHRKWGKSLLSAISELAPGAEVSKQRIKELEQGLINTSNAARQAGKLGLSFFDTIKQGMEKFSYWTSSTFIIMKTITEIKEAVSFAKEMDSALTNINYTMDVTKSQLTDIGNSSIQMAKDLKTSASDILGAVTLYANAKETADSILKKSEAAIMLGNVTGMSGEQSAKALQSVMNQFDMTQDDLMYISDTIQAVSQNMAYNFSSGIEEIVGGIERSGSVAKAAGLDLNEYASMLGLVIEKTGLSGETIGTAYRTILTRITKASKIEGTSDEDISKAETALNAVGVQVRSTAGEFRDMTDIMEDLGKVWNNLNDVQQANISYEIAGTRQTNIIKTLLGYWTDYEDLAAKAGNAAGTTLENQSKYEETLDAKTKELSTTMQSFWHNLIGAEEANGVLAIFQKVATALDTISGKLGSLGTIGLGAGIFAGIKNIGKTYKCTDFKIIC